MIYTNKTTADTTKFIYLSPAIFNIVIYPMATPTLAIKYFFISFKVPMDIKNAIPNGAIPFISPLFKSNVTLLIKIDANNIVR